MLPPIIAKLSSLVGRRPRPERREHRRLTPGRLTPCHLSVLGEEGQRPAWVHNLSMRGAGVLTDVEYPIGAKVLILLVNAAHTYSLTIEMKTARCFRVVNGDYFVGGRFTRELTHDELLPFML
jgi:hypothetical protein